MGDSLKLRLSTAVFALFVVIFAIPTFAQTSTTSTITSDDNTGGGGATGGNNANGSAIGNDVGGFFGRWFDMVTETQSEQPHWITPIATTTPRLEQEFRFDVDWTENKAGMTTDNIDGGKGLEIIPQKNIEVIFNLPPYLEHHSTTVMDGYGDVAFLVKYRLLASNEEHGNYILTAFLGWTIPTGTHNNGATNAIVTPTIAYGKGFGNFDVQGTFGVTLPTGREQTIGRTFLWNDSFQYHVFHKFWPEAAVNYTHFQDGEHDGMTQVFLTPGLVVGRFHIWKRVGFTIGGGYQIAVTHFHTTNHNGIFSMRFPF